jgi:hypothetical protein
VSVSSDASPHDGRPRTSLVFAWRFWQKERRPAPLCIQGFHKIRNLSPKIVKSQPKFKILGVTLPLARSAPDERETEVAPVGHPRRVDVGGWECFDIGHPPMLLGCSLVRSSTGSRQGARYGSM